MSKWRIGKACVVLLVGLAHSAGTYLFLMPSEAHAAAPSYRTARSKFSGGDLQGAERMLKSLLLPQPRISGRDLEEARKLLGVCYYLQGNKRDAQRVFMQALGENPKARLQPEDLLDPSVEGFFEQLRAKVRTNPVRPATRPPAAPPNAKARATPAQPAPKAMTGVQVSVNTKHATIFDNGIFVGTGGQSINLDPGRHALTISSEGYEDANKTVVLRPGQFQRFSVALQKPRPAAPPPSVARVHAPQGNNDEFGTKKKKTQMDYSGDLPGPKAGASLADEFFRDSQRSVQPPPPPPRAVQPAPRPVPAPQYQPPAPQYQQPAAPAYQQPAPQYQQPAAPAYQQPAPQYQQPAAPAYQQPAPQYQQPAAPAYQQPAPQYQQPAAPAYQQPVPTYQHPAGPAYRQPAPANPGYSPPPAPALKKGGKNGRSVALALLPFGVGQFQNGDHLKGGIFLTAEACGIGWALYSWKKEKDFTTAEAAAMADDDPSKPETLQNYDANESKTYRNSQRMNQYIGWGIFGVSWVVGIVDAIANIDSVPKRTSGMASLESEPASPPSGPQMKWGAFAYEGGGLGLQLNIKF